MKWGDLKKMRTILCKTPWINLCGDHDSLLNVCCCFFSNGNDKLCNFDIDRRRNVNIANSVTAVMSARICSSSLSARTLDIEKKFFFTSPFRLFSPSLCIRRLGGDYGTKYDYCVIFTLNRDIHETWNMAQWTKSTCSMQTLTFQRQTRVVPDQLLFMAS